MLFEPLQNPVAFSDLKASEAFMYSGEPYVKSRSTPSSGFAEFFGTNLITGQIATFKDDTRVLKRSLKVVEYAP